MNIIKNLNPNKALEYEDIPTKLIKVAAHSLPPFLTSIFNSCSESGHYPDKPKIARVTPLHRDGSKTVKAKTIVLYQTSLFITKYLEQLLSEDFWAFETSKMFLFQRILDFEKIIPLLLLLHI